MFGNASERPTCVWERLGKDPPVFGNGLGKTDLCLGTAWERLNYLTEPSPLTTQRPRGPRWTPGAPRKPRAVVREGARGHVRGSMRCAARYGARYPTSSRRRRCATPAHSLYAVPTAACNTKTSSRRRSGAAYDGMPPRARQRTTEATPAPERPPHHGSPAPSSSAASAPAAAASAPPPSDPAQSAPAAESAASTGGAAGA